MHRIRTIISIFLIMATFSIKAQQGHNGSYMLPGTVTVGSLEREFVYYIPKALKNHPKLVFVLHGATMTANQMAEITGYQFNKLADLKKDMIIVYPQGYKKYWNGCRKRATHQAKRADVDDIGFF